MDDNHLDDQDSKTSYNARCNSSDALSMALGGFNPFLVATCCCHINDNIQLTYALWRGLSGSVERGHSLRVRTCRVVVENNKLYTFQALVLQELYIGLRICADTVLAMR
eukprot:4678121-Pleurochrysis_carterae.AAC.1